MAVWLTAATMSCAMTGGIALQKWGRGRCMPKGGLGLTGPGIWIVLDSPNNELIIRNHTRWVGLPRDRQEMATVFDGKVYSSGSLPAHMQINECTRLSFEPQKVYFADAGNRFASWYKRLEQASIQRRSTNETTP